MGTCVSKIITSASSIEELLENCPRNQVIGDNLIRAWSKINSPKYKKIVCSISGGADSDVMLDIVFRCDKDKKVDYVWFDTGLEHQATKEHLNELESKYGIEIKKIKAIKPIPLSCRQYGQPFLSKRVSDYIHRLQIHNFKWEDDDYETLCKRYPRCKAVLKWWCNEYGLLSRFNISRNKFLKEFLIQYPPEFKISDKCCTYAKKKVVSNCIKNGEYDLNIYGVRKSEGGTRASAYKNCFDDNESGCDEYRPLFWYKNEDKQEYVETYAIENSRCYSEYGLKRTGCAGCPFGRDFEQELEIIQKYEPKLFKSVNNIFGQSYEYTRKYRQFIDDKKKEVKK